MYRAQTKSRTKKFLVVILLMILSIALWIPYAGQILVKSDQQQQADIIVVLMGSIPDRMLGAVDLYTEGYANTILMVQSHMSGYEVLTARGVTIPTTVDLNKEVAVSLGVPEEHVHILPGSAYSTNDEAIIFREYLSHNTDINSIALVTSKYHSCRAKLIFERALRHLDRDITIHSTPTNYDSFNERYWWRNREDMKRVVTEYLKLVNFFVRERYRL